MDTFWRASFAIMCAALASIPMLAALYRGEHAEFLRRMRLLEEAIPASREG